MNVELINSLKNYQTLAVRITKKEYKDIETATKLLTRVSQLRLLNKLCNQNKVNNTGYQYLVELLL